MADNANASGVGNEVNLAASATTENGLVNQTADNSQVAADTSANSDAEFEKLINGKFKEAYQKKVKSNLDQRFKAAKKTEDAYKALEPLLQEVRSRYNLSEEADANTLLNAFQRDRLYVAQRSVETGKSEEEVIRDIEREAQFANAQREAMFNKAELVRLRNEQKARDEAQQKLAEWQEEAEKLQSVIPGLDLNVEFQNRDFIELLDKGVPMEQVYKVIHFDEILSGSMASTAKAVEKGTVDKIKANGMRAVENGVNSQLASTSKVSVDNLTKSDILSILKKVENGEKVSF